jgi:hypothetical protein
MNIFRSEEHVARWLNGRSPGATIPVTTLCDLAYAWYSDRVSPDWRPRTAAESQAILARVGLGDEFWRLS